VGSSSSRSIPSWGGGVRREDGDEIREEDRVERREDYVVVDGGRSGTYDESRLAVGEGELSSTFLGARCWSSASLGLVQELLGILGWVEKVLGLRLEL